MKSWLTKLIVISITSVILFSCKKDEKIDYFLGGTAPVLTATVSGTIPLSVANKSKVEVVFSWSNPNYNFTTGLSSQNVTYLMEIDTLGANFSNPNKVSINISPDLGITFVDSVINSILSNQLLLATGISHTIQVKVTASINSVTTTKIESNILQFTVTPWNPPPAVAPPPNGTLYIVGSAVGGGWSNPIGAGDLAKQQFTQINPTLYQIASISIIGDGEYKFVGTNGSWNDQWSVQTEQPSGDPSTLGANLFFNGANCRAPIVSGNYKIVVDFQHGKFTFTKL